MTGGSAPAAPPMTMFCGRAPLEHHRVDDDVEADREQRQERRQDVDGPGHQADRDGPEDDPERDGALGRDRVGGQRPAAGPGHVRVDVALEVLVDRVRGSGGERPAQERPEREPRPVGHRHAGNLAGREDHRRHGRHEQQLDDPGLGQGDVRAHLVAHGRAAAVRGGADRRRPRRRVGSPVCALARRRRASGAVRAS